MRKITDKKELIKLCSFIIMGDGGAYLQKKNAFFAMNMIEDNLDFVEYCRDIFENITSSKIYQRKDYNNDGCNRKSQVRLQTKTHPFITKLRDRIYTGGYKGLDPHAMKMLDWESLSILYMSDGSLHSYKDDKKGMKNYSYNVTLNMKRLSYGDQLFLKKKLKDVFDLEWNINRQGKYYYLRLRMKDVHKFMNGIKEFILPSFSYKLLNDVPLQIVSEGDDIVCSEKSEVCRNDTPTVEIQE